MHAMEAINRQTWRNTWALRDYRRSSGYLNLGERRAFEASAFDMRRGRGQGRVLDIGVGGGRTAGLLRDVAATYLGIDYTAEMVQSARQNHPDLRFEQMDARDLSALADRSFDLVVFSYNGIDSVDAAGRRAILSEVSRVLAPGGSFVFSTFHRDWQGFQERIDYCRLEWTPNPVKLGFRTFRYVEGRIFGSLRMRRFSALEERTGEHAILLHGAHDFGVMVYATTPVQLQAQLSEAGFETPALLFDIDGSIIGSVASSDNEYFHVVTRKPILT
ncbi:class I SAM-dependent methyltransferase [Rhizobium sp. BK376]|uniref:class I SAM-dependent methyltransferase n=1 Tax=Rhizobium sp. BK376 TaxID=2512149 RepID=UPI00104912AF|nr:class I SAM-dependent methyltransferase [Rhizobium sp. BK376]TCR91835.1 ubiquinone/menaquinone biosynthesis C-methylase UbiE [Rhizobium sp. BK376]